MYNINILCRKNNILMEAHMVSGKRNQPWQASQTFTESIQEAMDRGLNARGLFFNWTKAYGVINHDMTG
jgi:hypothetical protein